MEKVKELLMRQMELLHEQSKKTRKTEKLVMLTRGVIGLSAEMRDIKCSIGTRTVVTTAFDAPNGDQKPG